MSIALQVEIKALRQKVADHELQLALMQDRWALLFQRVAELEKPKRGRPPKEDHGQSETSSSD